jgi:hypothetical protein
MEDLTVLNPHADLDVLAGAGEAIFEDQPAMFTEALLDWLATVPVRQHPQVEEMHPRLQAEAMSPVPEPIAPTPSVEASGETSVTPELDEVAASAKQDVNLDIADMADAAGVAESVAPLDESEVASAPAEQPDENTPARRSASAPATRATGRSMKAPASKARATDATVASRAARSPRTARPSSPKPETPAAGRSGRRGTPSSASGTASGTKNSQSTQPRKPSARKPVKPVKPSEDVD